MTLKFLFLIVCLSGISRSILAAEPIATAAAEKVSAEAEAEAFIKSCFQDYLENFEKADGGASARAEFDRIKDRCLSDKFKRNWVKLVKAANGDPLTFSQEVNEKWKAHIEVRNLSLSEASAQVRLGAGPKAHCLQVGLTHQHKNRQIDSSKLCSKN